MFSNLWCWIVDRHSVSVDEKMKSAEIGAISAKNGIHFWHPQPWDNCSHKPVRSFLSLKPIDITKRYYLKYSNIWWSAFLESGSVLMMPVSYWTANKDWHSRQVAWPWRLRNCDLSWAICHATYLANTPRGCIINGKWPWDLNKQQH